MKLSPSFRDKFLNLFMLAALFFFSTFFFLVYTKIKLRAFLDAAEASRTSLLALQQAVLQGTESIDAVAGQIAAFESIVTRGLLFAYVAVPVVLFVLFWLFEGWSWSLLREEKNLKFFLRFGIVHLAGALILLVPIILVWNQLNIQSFTFSRGLLLVPLTFIFLAYILTIFSAASGEGWRDHLAKMKSVLRPSLKILLAFLLYLAVLAFGNFSLFNLLFRYILETEWPIPLSISVGMSLLFLVAFVLAKMLLFSALRSSASSHRPALHQAGK